MKTKRTNPFITSLFTAIFTIGIVIAPAQAQEKKMRGESKYDAKSVSEKMDKMQMEIYSIMENYPEMDYHYVYENGTMVGVEITGIPDAEEREKLEKLLITLEDFQDEITEVIEVTEVYYVSETEPEPKMGYNDFYNKLYNNIYYPEEAKNESIEGTVYVKFVVDEEGEVSKVKPKTNIEARDYYVEQLKKSAADAIRATSGDWVPAKIGGEPVSRWMMLPVEFKLETPPGLRRLYPFEDDAR